MTTTAVSLKDGAERRAERYYQLGAVYGITAHRTDATDWDPVAKVIATADDGQTLTVRITARYGINGRIVTGIQAWTVSPANPDGSYIKTGEIVAWFQARATMLDVRGVR